MNKESFYQMCLNLGVVKQLIDNGYLDNETTISMKGAAYVDKKVEVEDDFVEKYRQKFSKKVIGISGKTGDYHGIKRKMTEFKKLYEYDDTHILKAVDNYINDNKRQPIYIMEAHYFIKKDGVSKLASYCEDLKDTSVKKEFFHE